MAEAPPMIHWTTFFAIYYILRKRNNASSVYSVLTSSKKLTTIQNPLSTKSSKEATTLIYHFFYVIVPKRKYSNINKSNNSLGNSSAVKLSQNAILPKGHTKEIASKCGKRICNDHEKSDELEILIEFVGCTLRSMKHKAYVWPFKPFLTYWINTCQLAF